MIKRNSAATTLPIVMLVVACLLRASAIMAGASSLQDDPDSYARLAVTWAEFGSYGFEQEDGSVRKTAFRPPLYPWLLSWTVDKGQVSQTQVGVFHFALSAISVFLVFSIARQLAIPYPWLPAVAFACDPLLLRASQLVMTETVSACLLLLGWQLWLALIRSHHDSTEARPSAPAHVWRLVVGGALGVSLGLATLARPTAAPWALLCVVFLGVFWKTNRSTRIWSAFAVMLGVLCCILPWTVRNYQVFGKPIWATTHGGYTLLLANNPRLYDHFRRNGPTRGWDAEPFHEAWAARAIPSSNTNAANDPTAEEFWFADRHASRPPTPSLDELQDDKLAYASAWACIQRSPGEFLISSLYRIGWYWAFWPYAPEFSWSVVAIGGWYAVWLGLALWSLGSRNIRTHLQLWLPAILLVVSLTTIHAVFWSNMRMRGPLMSCVYVVAAVRLGAQNQQEVAAKPSEKEKSQ